MDRTRSRMSFPPNVLRRLPAALLAVALALLGTRTATAAGTAELGAWSMYGSTTLDLTRYAQGQVQNLDEPVSLSMAVSTDGVQVTLYEGRDGTGPRLDLPVGTAGAHAGDGLTPVTYRSLRWEDVRHRVGNFTLYEDEGYRGRASTIRLLDHEPDRVYAIPREMHDEMTSLRWDLPPGVVVTLYDDEDGGHWSYTLGVGRGEDWSVADEGFNDRVSAFRWRYVDRTRGHVRLFSDAGFRGHRLDLYLDDYAPGLVHSLHHTGMSDDLSSLDWNLPDDVAVTFYDNADGTGAEFTIDTAMGNDPSTHDEAFGDRMSAFRWRYVNKRGGRFTLYDDRDGGAARIRRYLSDIRVGELVRINRTALQDATSSLTWDLPDGMTVVLYEDEGRGLGRAYRGRGYERYVGDRFNDEASSFRVFDRPVDALHARLDLPYDQSSFVTTHNAYAAIDEGWFYAQQELDIRTQLEMGVRALMLDIDERGNDVYLIHENWKTTEVARFGSGPNRLLPTLEVLRRFMDEHPDEVFTIIFEDKGASEFEGKGKTPELIKKQFVSAGLWHRVVTALDFGGGPWPTIAELVARGKTLVVFTDVGGKREPEGWVPEGALMYGWNYIRETNYRFPGDLSEREESERGERIPGRTLVTMNHFTMITNPLELLTAVVNYLDRFDLVDWGAADPLRAFDVQNSATILRPLIAAVRSMYGPPNFLAVDFFNRGDVIDLVRELNDRR